MERICVADIAETSRQIEWRPRTPLRDGLAQTIEWYSRHG